MKLPLLLDAVHQFEHPHRGLNILACGAEGGDVGGDRRLGHVGAARPVTFFHDARIKLFEELS